MVFSSAMGRWSWWLLPSETSPMAHEVMGYAVSPDAITMTAPASRKCVAMEGFKQGNLRFSIGSPAYSLDVPTTVGVATQNFLRVHSPPAYAFFPRQVLSSPCSSKPSGCRQVTIFLCRAITLPASIVTNGVSL